MNRLFLIVLVLLATLCTSVHADTSVSGTIISQTWTPAGSPYRVIGDIVVAGLTIEPGVHVVFMGDYAFDVSGVLTAVGTETDSIVFTRPDAVVGWKGIRFSSSTAGSELAYCVIEKATNRALFIQNYTLDIHHCSIRNNYFKLAFPEYPAFGGGIWTDSDLTLRNCVVSGNSVHTDGVLGPVGAISLGGGIAAFGRLSLENCQINGNSALVDGCGYGGSAGGGLYCASSLSMLRSQVSGNTAIATCFGGSAGGGVYSEGPMTATNSLVSGNDVISSGIFGSGPGTAGGIYVAAGRADIVNCTLAYNTNQGIVCGSDSVTVRGVIAYFNTGTQIEGIPLSVTYSDIEGGYAGTGNIALNPIFYDPSYPQIVPGSPCIDAGDPSPAENDLCFLPSLGGPRNDIGSCGGPGACGLCVGCLLSAPDGPGPSVDLTLSPNPASGPVRISYSLAVGGRVRIGVWDVQGRQVATLVDEIKEGGRFETVWPLSSQNADVRTGVYFVRMELGGRMLMKRALLLH